MFVNESTGKPLCCPHCQVPVDDSPCTHMVLVLDSAEGVVGGEWFEHFDAWLNRLQQAVVAYAAGSGKPVELLHGSVKKLRKTYRASGVPDDDAAEDAMCEVREEMGDVLECILSEVGGLKGLSGFLDSGFPGTSSDGLFYFAEDAEKALGDVEYRIDAMCAPHDALTKRSARKVGSRARLCRWTYRNGRLILCARAQY